MEGKEFQDGGLTFPKPMSILIPSIHSTVGGGSGVGVEVDRVESE